MKVPRDCIHCRHQGHTEVCDMYRRGDECGIAFSGDTWHIKEFAKEGRTKTGKINKRGNAINEKFKQRHGIMPKESR